MIGEPVPVFDPASQSYPALRFPKPCGTPTDITAGRGPSQWGWYEAFAETLYAYGKPEHKVGILDVGAGTGADLNRLFRNGYNPFVVGVDTDPGCSIDTIGRSRIIYADVHDIPSKSFDYVLCIDVIEHIVDDLAFLGELLRVAKRQLWVTTPNWHVSKCQNPHHCRELTPVQFWVQYQPDELWSGPSSGSGLKGDAARKLGQGRVWIGDPVGERLPHLLGVWKL